MRTILGTLPLFAPVFLSGIGIAAVLARRLAIRLRTRAALAFAVLASLGAILAATLPPDAATADAATRVVGCDFSRLGPAQIGEYVRLNDTSLNVLLFIPLGFTLTLLPPSRGRSALIVVAIVLTFAIETTQLLVPALGRGCQTADLFDNLLGLGIGALTALALGRVAMAVVPRLS